MLIRSKRGMNPESRYEKLISNSVSIGKIQQISPQKNLKLIFVTSSFQVFDTIRAENPALLKKLVIVPGDVSEPNLGMSDCDRKMLMEEVDIVFHSAATVRFNEKLKDAIRLNTLGTIKVIQLCKDMKNLKVIEIFFSVF